jgi:hypothetical protein
MYEDKYHPSFKDFQKSHGHFYVQRNVPDTSQRNYSIISGFHPSKDAVLSQAIISQRDIHFDRKMGEVQSQARSWWTVAGFAHILITKLMLLQSASTQYA